jgi:hypothetical protein
MRYTQHNPVPVPAVGPREVVPVAMDTVFDWEYALRRDNLLALYEKGKAATWNAADLDWSIDVDLERLARDRAGAGAHEVFNQLLDPPQKLERDQGVELNLNMSAWMLSQFLHGEQGALLATAKIVQGVPWEEAKWYAANQVADEARHVEVYHRYLTEKLGRSFPVNRHLRILLDQIISDARWDMTYLGMQIMVEGLALAAFGLMKLEWPDEPLIQDITTRIMGDEARHVAFGVLSLEHLYTRELSERERAEREELVIEATHLMRDRLLMEDVYERTDLDPKVWVAWSLETPFMRGFRQMLFSKIVPNLKRLGLLTPRVREVYRKLDLLRFEHLKDSSVDPEITPPAELVQMLLQLRATAATSGAPGEA